jgi:formylglycine-generating enzyme required for sulfatase activity
MQALAERQDLVFPDPFPADWAEQWGEDRYGLWMALTYSGARQVFRWIAPGSFLMGSPASEPERDGDEVQHRVILSRGYWLADTACTKSLWRAVLGSNPGHFKEDERNPVEQVSWDHARGFVAALNRLVPGLGACLPTEAQWEYACRAGTETPFSFGDKITPEKVNYDGDYPYARGRKGLYRKKAVAVGSLPANAWGLYDMHGNVWEWCEDWYGAYPAGPAVDPAGPETGVYRVLRGGSWHDNGRNVRSAVRGGNEPGHRDDDFGFRLALGQMPGR